jgi:methylglutaconyl-CoA hydratase
MSWTLGELPTKRSTGRLIALCERVAVSSVSPIEPTIGLPCVLASHSPITISQRVVVPSAALSSRLVPSNLRTERDGDVLRITMARPDRRNAFDAALIAELAEAFVAVGRARAVVLAGDGPSFSAGADVDWMRSSVDLSYEENVADANALRAMLEAIDSCPAPVVARVQGHALGGGAGLVAATDIAIAAPDAVFAFSEVKLGIIPAVISPFALARIGPGDARRYFVTGERFDVETALRIGLVQEVADDLDGAVGHVVGELLSAGPQAARWAKRLVRERPDGPETARWIAERRTSDEGQEGLRAFLEKRPASWRD